MDEITITKPYIVTDPFFITDKENYNKKVLNMIYENEEEKTPINAFYFETTEPIIIYKVKLTKNGNGSYTYHEQEIASETGLLCIAKKKDGWEEEECGAMFETLTEAKDVFNKVVHKL